MCLGIWRRLKARWSVGQFMERGATPACPGWIYTADGDDSRGKTLGLVAHGKSGAWMDSLGKPVCLSVVRTTS